jgi:hypothetical protein
MWIKTRPMSSRMRALASQNRPLWEEQGSPFSSGKRFSAGPRWHHRPQSRRFANNGLIYELPIFPIFQRWAHIRHLV